VGQCFEQDGGARLEIEPEDQAQVVKYLSKNFGSSSGGKKAEH